MEEHQVEGTTAAPAAPEVTGFTTRLTNVFTSPGELFDEIAAVPVQTTSWLIPWLVLMALIVVATFTVFNNPSLRQQAYDIQTRKLSEMVAQGKMTQDMMDRQVSGMENSGPGLFIAIGAGSRIFIMTLVLFFGALLYWLGARIVLKYRGGYKKILEVAGISWSVGILGAIVTILLLIVMNSLFATPSPALLLGDSFNPASFSHRLLAGITVFGIWETVLIGMGLAKVAGKPAGGGMAIAFTLWAIGVCLGAYTGG